MDIPIDQQDYKSLLIRFNRTRDEIINNLVLDIDNFKLEDIFPYDPRCVYTMGHVYEHYSQSYCVVQNFKCTNCKIFQSLKEYQNQFKFVISKIDNACLDVSIEHIQDYIYVQSCRFVINFLIGWYLEKKVLSINQIQPIYYAFMCGRYGYYLTSQVAYGPITLITFDIDHDDQIVKYLITDLIRTLNLLNNVSFINFRVIYNSLLLDYPVGESKYDYIIKFNNFSECGIIIPTGNKSLYISYEQIWNPPYFSNVNMIITAHGCDQHKCYIFRVSNTRPSNEYKAYNFSLSELIIPYNIYCYFVLLMSNPSIYQIVHHYPPLLELWTSMWKKSDLNIIEDRITHAPTNDRNFIFNNLIMDIDLQVDILSVIQEKIDKWNI